MQLQLVAWTPQPDRTCAVAARLCYSDDPPELIREELDEKQVSSLIARILRNGHLSVLEHANFTFAASELSRACTHQLVRHRLASYSQQSQRHVRAEHMQTVIPPSIRQQEGMEALFRKTVGEAIQAYRQLLQMGIPMEDARYLLPQAIPSRILFTMNARQLRHFFHERCCERAQWEIRGLAWLALRKAQEVAPRIFEQAGPPCFEGVCPEVDSPCWRERSAFFRSSFNLFRQALTEIAFLFEERRFPVPATRPEVASRFLGLARSQILWPAWVKGGEKTALLLSSDPRGWLGPVSVKTGVSWTLLSESECCKRGFSPWATPWLPTARSGEYRILWDDRLSFSTNLAFNLGTPWRYGVAPALEILATLRRLGLPFEMV